MRFRFLSLAALLATFAFAPTTFAQKDKSDGKAEKKDDDAPKKDDDAAKKDDDAAKKDDDKDDAAATKPATAPESKSFDPHDPAEEPGKTHYFIGARWRQTYLPKFMLDLFVAGGPKQVWIPGFGIEGGMRKDGFDSILSITYQDWGMDAFAFKGKNEAATAWEIVNSRLKLINIAVDLLWSTDFNKSFSFQYGMDAGIAVVLGDLARVQGKPRDASANRDNPDDIVPCNSAPGRREPAPGEPADFCGKDNDHYGDYTENSWFNGGKKPNIYAVFGPHMAFRFKPVKEFVARFDFGWNIFAGPFFGLAANYGL